jgi:hypothetical protein
MVILGYAVIRRVIQVLSGRGVGGVGMSSKKRVAAQAMENRLKVVRNSAASTANEMDRYFRLFLRLKMLICKFLSLVG